MYKVLIMLAMVSIPCLIVAQENAVADSIWFKENYEKLEVMISARDGVKLFAAIYQPKDKTTKHPILLNRTPYSCRPYGVDQWRAIHYSYYMKYAKEKYIFVFSDVRGRYMSEGEFIDIRPFNPQKKGKQIDEASDTYDTVDWLIKNTSNNGNVGVIGTSYPGFYATMASLSNHKAIKAVSPQAPVTDWFIGDDFHHNGAFCLMDGFSFYTSFGKPRKEPHPDGNRAPGYKFNSNDNYNFYLKMGALKNSFKPEYMDTNVVFWKDLFAHPNYDSWWEARNVRKYMRNIQPAMLTVGGLFDAEDCWGAWNLYKAIEQQNSPTINNAIVMGPWIHGGWSRTDGSSLGNVHFNSNTAKYFQDNIEFPFFQKYLNPTAVVNTSKITEANIFFSGSNEWQHLPKWPPANAIATNFYLHPQEQINLQKPTYAKSHSDYTSNPNKPVPYTEDVHLRRTTEYMTDDQRFASRRNDVLTFSTSILNEDLTVAGTPLAKLFTSISTTDADFVVKIIDVFPDTFKYDPTLKFNTKVPMGGYQMLVRGEIFRGKYKSGFANPTPFKTQTVTAVDFALPDIAHTFKKGHKLMIQIQSSWFPLMDRNPQQFLNIYECNDKDFVPSNINIWHDKDNSSHIVLPIVKNF
jgi:uncharacterized protein